MAFCVNVSQYHGQLGEVVLSTTNYIILLPT